VTDKLGKTYAYAYNPLGRLAQVTNPLGESTTFGYDAHGWLTSITDPAGKTVQKSYDKEGVISSLTDPLSHTWSYATNALGSITSITTPLGHATSYGYDSMGRITSLTSPLSHVTNYFYDQRGLLSQMELPEGISATYDRNALGLITSITDPRGNAWQLSYDKEGLLVSRTDPLGRTFTYEYDSRNRLSKLTMPNGKTMQITRDETGNIIRRLYSDGTDLQYTYNALNRLTSANGLNLGYNERGEIVGSNGIGITRDDLGRIASVTLAPGKAITYTYNNRGLVSKVEDWAGGSVDFTYDDAGRLVSIQRSNGVTTTFAYDDDGRLVGIKEAKGAQTLSEINLARDGEGKITSATRDVPLLPSLAQETKSWTYNQANEIEGFTYDQLGRLTQDGQRTYTWDLAGRLLSYTEGGVQTNFAYDALGQMISRTRGGVTREFVWNYALGLPSVSVVRDGGQDVRYYVHAPSGVLLYGIDANDNTRHFYHFDEMGSTLFLTDSAGNITDSYGLTPYGKLTAQGSTTNPFTFVGAYGVMQVGDTGLYYMRARFYDAQTARFISRDPVQSIGPRQLNPYQYALNNPLRVRDVTGLQSQFHTGTDPVYGRWTLRQTKYGMRKVIDIESQEYWKYFVEHMRLKARRLLSDTWTTVGFLGIAETWDSPLLHLQHPEDANEPLFYFRGKIMMGAELNYFFLGLLYAEGGYSEEFMLINVYGWNWVSYFRDPNPAQLLAVKAGYWERSWKGCRDSSKFYKVAPELAKQLGINVDTKRRQTKKIKASYVDHILSHGGL